MKNIVILMNTSTTIETFFSVLDQKEKKGILFRFFIPFNFPFLSSLFVANILLIKIHCVEGVGL